MPHPSPWRPRDAFEATHGRFIALLGLSLAIAVACVACGGGPSRAAAGPRPGGPATHRTLAAPAGLALDAKGNLYVAEFDGARVDRIAPDGRLSVIAGAGTEGYAGDGRRAVAARLSKPIGLALDEHGDLAIADSGNDVIREVESTGRITTLVMNEKLSDPVGIAFNGDDIYIADAGDVSVLRVRPSGSWQAVAKGVRPGYLAFDTGGNLYLSDSGHSVVVQILADDISEGREGISTTVAGNGSAGFGGDGGAATEARVDLPLGVAFDTKGNLYVADSNNNRVRKIDSKGIITTIAGSGKRGFGGDGGAAKAAKLDAPAGLAIDGAGNLYIADQGNNRIRRVDTKGVITTVAGTGATGQGRGRRATQVKLSGPEALAFDARGNLYVSEFLDARVVKITPGRRLTVVAGTGTRGSSGDGGRAVAAQLSEPAGLALDSRGNLFIADYDAGVVRKVDPAGVITTIGGGAARLHNPIGLAAGDGFLYVADAGNDRVVRIDASGALDVVASGVHPAYLLVASRGKLDMSDLAENSIRQIDLARSGPKASTIRIAGTGTAGFSGDGSAATTARLDYPYGLAMDSQGNLYVSDRKNNRVRRIDRRGVITTVAGTGAAGYAGDGGRATVGKLDSPVGLALDAAGNLYIADSGNNRLRRVDRRGIITTFAGGG